MRNGSPDIQQVLQNRSDDAGKKTLYWSHSIINNACCKARRVHGYFPLLILDGTLLENFILQLNSDQTNSYSDHKANHKQCFPQAQTLKMSSAGLLIILKHCSHRHSETKGAGLRSQNYLNSSVRPVFLRVMLRFILKIFLSPLTL